MSEKLRVAIVLGRLGAAVHGKLDASRAFDDENSFVTGTVGGFLTIAWGLAERGHIVDAFCEAKETVIGCKNLGGANVYSLDEARPDDSYDAYISILEPDVLRHIPNWKPKILVQWLNDFTYCKPGHEEFIDIYVCPSETHQRHLTKKTHLPIEKTTVIPLACNPELYAPGTREAFSLAYASSPDRGLHHLLDWWPEIRERIPSANLRVYYRVLPWCDEILREPGQRGSDVWKRAKKVKNAFDTLGTNGKNGLHLIGPVPQRRLMHDLGQTKVLAYPLDSLKFTEGFSVTVLDACASGCVPIISGMDAFPELWWGAAHIIFGKPGERRDAWISTICEALLHEDFASEVRTNAKLRARELTRGKVARRWEEVIEKTIAKKKNNTLSDQTVIEDFLRRNEKTP